MVVITPKILLSIKDIADLANTTPNVVSNWKTRDIKFPQPYAEPASGAVWKSEDIAKYLTNEKNIYTVFIKNYTTKKIAVIGRARTGKSFLVSRFVRDKEKYHKLFCGGGSDETVCPVITKINVDNKEEYTFHTNFNSLFSETKLKDGTDISEIKNKVTELVGKNFDMDDTDSMNKIKSLVSEINKLIIENKELPTYLQENSVFLNIETFQCPNKFCYEMMNECKINTLIFTDTPGVSGDVQCANIAKSDAYIFCLRPENTLEADTLINIVDKIKADVAAATALFVYKSEAMVMSKEEYDCAQDNARHDMAAFNDKFEKLKGSIISTGIDVMNPAEHCIVIPPMYKDKISAAEEFFMNSLTKRLSEAFISDYAETEFNEIVKENKQHVKELVLELMSKIPPHKIDTISKDPYTIENFCAEKHDRVMTNDRYRLICDLQTAYNRECELLYKFFDTLKPDDFRDDRDRKVIKYLYSKLTKDIKADRGLGIGAHPFEDSPARTMRVEESLLADVILNKIKGKNDSERCCAYRKALESGNVSSKTWNYVVCDEDDDMVRKLEIIDMCFIKHPVTVYTSVDLILCRHVGGLRKLAQYDIFRKLGLSDQECMDVVKALPFF